jgi:hypothetical protein
LQVLVAPGELTVRLKLPRRNWPRALVAVQGLEKRSGRLSQLRDAVIEPRVGLLGLLVSADPERPG